MPTYKESASIEQELAGRALDYRHGDVIGVADIREIPLAGICRVPSAPNP